MSELVYRHFFASEISDEQAWQLVEWCIAHGASEFIVNCLGYGDRPSPFCDQLEERLQRFSSASGASSPQQPSGWRLDTDSLAILRELFPVGIFAEPTFADEGWVEDLRCLRDGQGMLWFVNHEDYGFVRLTPAEHVQILELGIPTHPVSV